METRGFDARARNAARERHRSGGPRAWTPGSTRRAAPDPRGAPSGLLSGVLQTTMAKPVTSPANANLGALLLCPNAKMMAELLPLLTHNIPGVQIHSVKEYPDAGTLADFVVNQHPRLCFLDVDTDPERALALIRELQLLDATLPIIVLLGQNEPDLILRCLRQGATEFLMQPFSAEELAPVLQRLSQLTPSMNYGSGGRVICVAPAKGACGASTIAANLAT
ncbi:MAG TPA: response regulator, partial [Bryobacterales bacterium]|nr:response regulator [Bryobacterales bacterium]